MKIIVTSKMTDNQLDRLRGKAELVEIGWGKTGNMLTEDEMSAALMDADILLVGYENVPSRVILNAPQLKLIGCSRSNPVNIDHVAATQRGIPVLYTPGRNANAAAEFTMGLMLSAARNIGQAFHAMKSNQFLGEPMDHFSGADVKEDVVWTLDGPSPYKLFRGVELCGRTLGLIGLGNIGTRVVKLAQAFGMRVIAFDPYLAPGRAHGLNVEMVSLEDLLRQADFISVHCKVSKETIGLLGPREFSLMKPTAYLINTARAVIVDQASLIDALKNKKIAGAAMDVYWYEPLPSNHPLLSMDNVTLTPHLGGSTVDVPERHSKMIVDDVLAWMEGGQPERVYNAVELASLTTN
jgi:D-3-phosphoglycerate dehydrogenase